MSSGPPVRSALKALSQLALMAAIVATLAYLPVCIILALVLRATGISFESLLTLNDALHPAVGLVVWWLFIFVGACAYAASVFPWGDRIFGWSGRK